MSKKYEEDKGKRRATDLLGGSGEWPESKRTNESSSSQSSAAENPPVTLNWIAMTRKFHEHKLSLDLLTTLLALDPDPEMVAMLQSLSDQSSSMFKDFLETQRYVTQFGNSIKESSRINNLQQQDSKILRTTIQQKNSTIKKLEATLKDKQEEIKELEQQILNMKQPSPKFELPNFELPDFDAEIDSEKLAMYLGTSASAGEATASEAPQSSIQQKQSRPLSPSNPQTRYHSSQK